MVGGLHSGADLLRELLGAFRGVHDLGETGVFAEIVGRERFCRPWTLLGLSSGHERRMVGRLQARPEDHGAGIVVRRPPRDARLPRCFAAAVAMLDRMALSAGSRSWVEHTPGVAAGLARLERLVPRLHVVHVLRDGRDVVASHCLEAASRRGGRCRGSDVRRAVTDWNRAIGAQARVAGRPGHTFVFYEDLIARPERELAMLAGDCGLDVVGGAWSDSARELAGGSARTVRARFRELFDRPQRRRIESALDLARYGHLAERLRHDPLRAGRRAMLAAGPPTAAAATPVAAE